MNTMKHRIERLEREVFDGADDPLRLATLTIEEERYLLAGLVLSSPDISPAEREEAGETIARLAGCVRESHLLAVFDHWLSLDAAGYLTQTDYRAVKQGKTA